VNQRIPRVALLISFYAVAAPPQKLTRAQQEEFLSKASIVSETGQAAAARQAWRVTLDDGMAKHDALVETETATGTDSTQRDYRFNIAAYELDKALELNLVVPVVARNIGGRPASLTWWTDDILMNELTRRNKKVEPPDPDRWNKQMQAVRVFDELTANAYRKTSASSYLSTIWDNLLITRDWRIWITDHTRSFQTTRQLDDPQSLTQCDRTLLNKLRNLNREAFKRKLEKYLNPEQLDALEARRKLLVKHFNELIGRKGERAMLYDLSTVQ
jgi:hypothetical protein